MIRFKGGICFTSDLMWNMPGQSDDKTSVEEIRDISTGYGEGVDRKISQHIRSLWQGKRIAESSSGVGC